MDDPLRLWHEEHVQIARLLGILDRQLAAFHRGEHPNYELMSHVVYYLREHGDCVHHRREDAAFVRLAACEPDLELVISRLRQEHRVIAAAGDELARLLEEAQTDIFLPRATLEAAAALYLVYYRNHLVTEEQRILPRAAQRLSAADWQAVGAAVPSVEDPLFGANVAQRFQELRRQIEREPERA
jgi:hemerythrin-like domain-containing protein